MLLPLIAAFAVSLQVDASAWRRRCWCRRRRSNPCRCRCFTLREELHRIVQRDGVDAALAAACGDNIVAVAGVDGEGDADPMTGGDQTRHRHHVEAPAAEILPPLTVVPGRA